MDVISQSSVTAYITADGSQVREFMNSHNSSVRHQSLAEATLAPGGATREHYHPRAEEIYHILQGEARMRVEDEERRVVAGDTIAIPPAQKHKIWNTGDEPLVFLCCCAPGYSHEDTVLTE